MNRMLKVVLSCMVLAGICRLGFAQNWSRCLSHEGNGISKETGLAQSWPSDGPKKLCSQNTGTGFSSPIAMDGKVYLFFQDGSNDILRTFDAQTGTVAWSQS